MKFFRSILLFIMIVLIGVCFVNAETNMKIMPKEKAAVRTKGEYIFVNEKTPEYILKKAVSKGIAPAFLLKGSDAGWIRGKLEIIKTSSPVIFVDGNLTELEKKYFEELIKYTDYRAQIICYSENCLKKGDWKHPLIKRVYTITREKDGDIVMEGPGMKSTARKHSALDDKDFVGSPEVKGGLYFENLSFAFISLDLKVESSFYENASKVVYYSNSEKKMSDFVEKKF